MVPDIVHFHCDDKCRDLYTHLDLVQGKFGRPARGYSKIAEALGWQPRTVSRHAGHLVELGLVRVARQGNGSIVLEVVHNPARLRFNPACTLEPVDRRSPPKAGTRAGHPGRRV